MHDDSINIILNKYFTFLMLNVSINCIHLNIHVHLQYFTCCFVQVNIIWVLSIGATEYLGNSSLVQMNTTLGCKRAGKRFESNMHF